MSKKDEKCAGDILSWHEIEVLYKRAIERKDYVIAGIIIMCSYYGLHISEALELTWEDVLNPTVLNIVNHDNRFSQKNIPVNKTAYIILKNIYKQLDYPKITDKAFKSRKGTVYSVQRINVILKLYSQYLKRKIHLVTESFRKSFGHHIYTITPQELKPSCLYMLSKYFNHFNTIQTLEYIGIDDDNKEFNFLNIHEVFEMYNDYTDLGNIDISKYERGREAYVYLTLDEKYPDVYKIGWTVDMSNREKTLRHDAPYYSMYKYLTFPDQSSAFKHERMLHKKYADYNIRGEWYELPVEILNEILNEYNWDDYLN